MATRADPALRSVCRDRGMLAARSAYAIRPVCFREDDGHDDDADEPRSGHDGESRATEARANDRRIGASREQATPYPRKRFGRELPTASE